MSRNYSIDGYKVGSKDRNNPYNVIPSGRITMGNVLHPIMGIDDRGTKQMMYPGNEYQFPGSKVLEIPLKDTNMNKKVIKNGGSNMFWNGTKWVSSADGGTYSNGVYYQRGGVYSPNYQFTGAAAIAPNAEDSALYNSQFNSGMDMINNNPSELINRYNYWQNAQQNAIPPTGNQEQYNNFVGGQRINQTNMDAWKDAGTQYIQRNYPTKGYPGGPTRKQLLKQVGEYQNGGPTFPNGGAAPIFGMGGTASFNVSNNEYPTPFAMYPGTGNGGGYLQDLPTTMQMGGTTTRDGEYVYPFAMYAGSGQGAGMLEDLPTEMKTGGNWIKGAVNPAHKGYCTPMTKSTCTPRRKAFAMTMKKHHGFHEYGGNVMQDGGYSNPWQSANPQDDITAQVYAQRENTQGVVQNAPMYGQQQPMVTSDSLSPNGNGTNPNYQVQGQQNTQQPVANGNPLAAWGNAVFGAGMLGLADASLFNDIHQQKVDRLRNTNRGLSENSIGVFNQPGGHGDYTNQGMFRPDSMVPTRAGYFPNATRHNGYMQHGGYTNGQELDMDEAGIENLRRMGYNFEIL